MRNWMRVAVAVLCGRCGDLIPSGEPVQRLVIRGLTSVKLRCVKCAGEQAPKSLDPMPVMPFQRAPAGMTVVASLAKALPFDYKTKMLGEREPEDENDADL